MIPLKDDNPTQGKPIVSYGIIGFCILIFLAQTWLRIRPDELESWRIGVFWWLNLEKLSENHLNQY